MDITSLRTVLKSCCAVCSNLINLPLEQNTNFDSISNISVIRKLQKFWFFYCYFSNITIIEHIICLLYTSPSDCQRNRFCRVISCWATMFSVTSKKFNKFTFQQNNTYIISFQVSSVLIWCILLSFWSHVYNF